MNTKTRKNLLLNEGLLKMVDEIAKEGSYATFTSVIEAAIRLLHKKTIDYRVLGAKRGPDAAGMSPSELARIKVEQKEAEKKAEQDMKDEKKTKICERELFGKVITDDGGYKYCIFNTNTRTESKQNKAPLGQADPVMARTLFIPSRDAVFAARPELAKELGFVYHKKSKTYVAKEEA